MNKSGVMVKKHLKVYNRNTDDKVEMLRCVYVGRGSDWGNPFVMRNEKDRNHVCANFEMYAIWRLKIEPDWLDALKGKNLICYCAPKRCHGDTLLRLANE